MADIVKTTSELSMVQEFTDGDTRTLTVPNPNTAINLTQAVQNLSTLMAADNTTIGDKDGADFFRIKSAKVVHSSTTYYDLTPEG